MPWGKPEYDSKAYNKAGRTLIDPAADGVALEMAYQVINNWRSSHYRPLDTIQKRVRKMAVTVDGDSLVVQRIKRLSSIRHKMERFTTRLIQMQDIAGCRAILSTIEHVDRLAAIMAVKDKERKGRGVKHKLINQKDYIRNPKESGYRGIHLIFEYQSDKMRIYNGLLVELQIRTFVQHAWATAVETVGTFIGQALKSSMGNEEWQRFFSLASSAMAAYEGTTLVPGTPQSPDELRKEVRVLYEKLEVARHLRAYAGTINLAISNQSENVHYFLLELNAEENKINVFGYNSNELEKASSDYLEMEKSIKDGKLDAVLVSAESIAALRRAYPNYFLDTETFLSLLAKIIA